MFQAFFNRSTRDQRKVEKLSRKILDRRLQSDFRREAIATLSDLTLAGNDAALAALINRFSFTYDQSIHDREEKEQVAELLLQLKDRSIPFLKQFVKQAETVSWALKLLKKLTTTEAYIAELIGLLDYEDDAFDRIRIGRKMELLEAMKEVQDPSIVDAVLPLFDHVDDTIRFATIDVLEGQADLATRERLLEQFEKEADSRRNQIRILELFARLDWPIKGHRSAIDATTLPRGFSLTREGKIRIAGETPRASAP